MTCFDGSHEVVGPRDWHAVACHMCRIARESTNQQEAIVVHYDSDKSIAVGRRESVDYVRDRLERGEHDIVRTRADGSYMVVSRDLTRVANTIIDMMRRLQKGEKLDFHRPNGDLLIGVESGTARRHVWFELTKGMKGSQAAA